MYVREDADDFEIVDRWDGGLGWIAHPSEGGRRASHAVRVSGDRWTDGDVLLFDPLDATGISSRIDDLGDVAGVVVCSDYHARDAESFARRYDVPVFVPAWLDRAESRIDAPTERVSESLAGFELRELRPLRAWREVAAYRERDGTLYVPDFFASEKFAVGDERFGMPFLSRLSPPREQFRAYRPQRILFGHGVGVFEDATRALEETLDGARKRFPRALVANVPTEIRAMVSALR